MASHKAVGVTYPAEAFNYLSEKIKESPSVSDSPENGAAMIASTGDMVKGSFKCDAGRAAHKILLLLGVHRFR